MKKIFLPVALIFCALFCACQTVPEEQISALETYYLKEPSGGNIFLEKYGSAQNYYAILSAAIEKNLDDLGYRRAESEKDAQFIVSPRYYPETIEYPDISAPKLGEPAAIRLGTALNLSIRITTPSGQFLFSGDTRCKLVRENLNKYGIEKQAMWALKYFPPRAGAQK